MSKTSRSTRQASQRSKIRDLLRLVEDDTAALRDFQFGRLIRLKQKRPDEINRPAFEFVLSAYGFQIMSATVLPAGMNGMTCVL